MPFLYMDSAPLLRDGGRASGGAEGEELPFQSRGFKYKRKLYNVDSHYRDRDFSRRGVVLMTESGEDNKYDWDSFRRGYIVNKANYMQVLPSCPSYEVCPKTKELGNSHDACRIIAQEVNRNEYPNTITGTYDRHGQFHRSMLKIPIEAVFCTTCKKYFIKYREGDSTIWEIDT